MARKLGDVVIGMIVLLFVITGFSLFIIQADQATQTSSGIVRSSFSSYDDDLSGVKTNLESELTKKTDATGNFNVEDGSQQVEERGSETTGIMNLISKNIIVAFLNSIKETIPGSTLVIGFIISLMGVTISILVLRFFWGENKI